MGDDRSRKVCWCCEGNVPEHATKCPFCATDLSALNSLQPEQPAFTQAVEELAPQPPYTQVAAEPLVQAQEAPTGDSVVLPMLLLLPGAFFLLFGLILFLFATDGVLTLQWNARYSLLYLVLAAPLLFLGWRAIKEPPTNDL